MKLVLASLVLIGCASPQRIDEGARNLEIAAQQAEARGDYVTAAKKREAAAKQYRKAQYRREAYPYYY